jgi:UDP-glucose 6-dehydrogenase
MGDLRKRIFLELLITPATVIPVLVGGSMLLLSQILGGHAAFLGFVGLLFGFGSFLTNLVFNLEKISKRALKQWHEQQTNERERSLNDLDARLQKTKDKRDENVLRNLRLLYSSFNVDVQEGNLSDHVPSQMLQSIDEIFEKCVSKLERSYQIYKTSEIMTGDLKKNMQEQRESAIIEVEKSVLELSGVINEVRALKFKNERDDLRELQRKLSSQLEIAKATEDGMASIMSYGRVEERLKEYE